MLWRLPMPRSHCWIAIACCGAGLAAGLQGPKAVGSGSAHVGSHLGCVVMGCVVMGCVVVGLGMHFRVSVSRYVWVTYRILI